ncbi:DAN domain family member 5 [Neovison vison]|uniref:DAN domain family member 5 n=1 Tax=Neovison vison TaxID=452646 RepID=A0A8C7EKF6_NEOVI|nr:DAN domain family member 5 [Neogale vison]
MFLGQLTTLLSLLSGARFHTGSGRPGLLGPPPQLWDATNQTRALGQGTLGSQGQSSALSSWKAFLGLQKTGLLGRGSQHHGQEVAPTVSLPLDPQEVAQEMCKAVPYTQVLSRPGCSSVHLRNHLCFGRCSSLYIPSSQPAPLVLCNSCVPARKRRTPVLLWCRASRPDSRRRMKTSTVLVEGCQCSPKA